MRTAPRSSTAQAPGPVVDRAPARSATTGTTALVVVGSLALGAATSWAQGLLPDALSSFANSASGWTICTALLVAWVRPSVRAGAMWGPVGFGCLVLGYTLASHVRGYAYDPTVWLAVGLVAGPFVGAAAAAVSGPGSRLPSALGSGLLAGVLVGDGVRGLTVVAATTSPVYWTIAIVVGLALLVATAGVRLRAPGLVALQVAGCAVVATVLVVGLGAL